MCVCDSPSPIASHPSSPVTGIPRDVRLMGEKCMLKNAKERPSFADLIQELQEVEEVAGEC